ncbi:zinc-ribbon domain-containing protein [Candidatus Bathyarchaeota archaeon]|nr:zinc-ribbon domain-containing protein [Candidatus Bathyarchaeota archaeon]
MATDIAVKLNAVNNKWVNAINNQLSKRQIEQLSNHISKCPNCGKQIPQGDFGFCPFCGTSLKVR